MSAAALDETNKQPATPKKPTAWSSHVQEPVKVLSLQEVMSEQLANDLHAKECSVYESVVGESKKTPSSDVCKNELSKAEETSTKEAATAAQIDITLEEQMHNDFLIAQLLQLECDREYDHILKGQENHRNKNSKVSVSYDNFKSVHPVYDKDDKEIEAIKLMNLSSESESEDGNFTGLSNNNCHFLFTNSLQFIIKL
jgi:hypothetical protein